MPIINFALMQARICYMCTSVKPQSDLNVLNYRPLLSPDGSEVYWRRWWTPSHVIVPDYFNTHSVEAGCIQGDKAQSL